MASERDALAFGLFHIEPFFWAVLPDSGAVDGVCTVQDAVDFGVVKIK